MKEDSVLIRYDVLCINRKNKQLAKDIKSEINKREIEARSKGQLGLILLAGNMLSLGITLNLCDLVILMNNALSSDKVLQQMYRCMTESENKTIGIVVDLNISRVINTCINYTVNDTENKKSIDDKMKYLIYNNLINIDVDMMFNKKINADMIIKKLMDIWKDDPINSFRTLLRKLDNDYEMFDNPTQKLINSTFTKSLNGNNVNVEIVLKDSEDENQELPRGEERVREIIEKEDKIGDKQTEENQIEENQTEESKEIHISFTKDVLPYIIPLTCILTVKDSNMDFVKMLMDIKDNPELLETFDDQCLIWWNKKDLIDMIKDIIDKYFDKNSNTYNISIQFKMSLQSLIDKPKELLELINDCLKPKDVEKKQFGEVFTPIDFINNKMLKDIENYWLKTYDENIWTNEKLTWYDPAAGMGNYPIAIYYKLLDGLKNKIPDEELRKKHIIEKQLYMGELNKKNCQVIKQIFNMHNNYNLNLYQGDTLTIKLNEIFGISKFDIIIGNPPYNEELTKVGAKPLYNKFIEYYVNKCEILSFIVPSRWFSGGKGLDKFREMMLKRKDIVYINHFNDACKIFGNLVDIKGGVNYFLIDKSYSGLCSYNGSFVQLNKYDIMIDSKYYTIIDKIQSHDSIIKYYISQDHYKIQTNDTRLVDEHKQNHIKCYVSQQKGFVKYIKKDDIKKPFDNYKVITARAAHGANSCFGNTFIGKPNEVHTKSYISFNVQSEEEARSLISYMKCKLPNFMLSLRKISQDISENTCKWIPLVPLDRYWTDKDVYDYFKLSKDDIQLIKNTKIVGYKEQKEQKIKLKIFKIDKLKGIFDRFDQNVLDV